MEAPLKTWKAPVVFIIATSLEKPNKNVHEGTAQSRASGAAWVRAGVVPGDTTMNEYVFNLSSAAS